MKRLFFILLSLVLTGNFFTHVHADDGDIVAIQNDPSGEVTFLLGLFNIGNQYQQVKKKKAIADAARAEQKKKEEESYKSYGYSDAEKGDVGDQCIDPNIGAISQ